jgi:protein-S-isoprenylcysteine O-methyltransferase Ste14
MENQDQIKPTLTPNQALIRMLAGMVVSNVFIAILIFVAAGRLDWKLGWLFVIVWGLLKYVFVLLLRWHDPDLMVERSTKHENTQPYDKTIIPFYFVFAFLTIFVAGLDGGRFRWSGDIPILYILATYIIYLLANGLASWSVSANPYFSSESRLQTDRHQIVTKRGPYQWVRHPAYLATILIWPVTGVMLESWWAVIPGVITAILMVIRTKKEDSMLLAELDGYQDYAKEVRYRLFPGIW